MAAPTITPDREQALAGVKIEEDGEPNDCCLSKVSLTAPDGKVYTSVICTREVFNRAIDLLEGVMVGDGHRATKEDLQKVKDAKVVSVVRGEKTEPLFKMFGVITKWMSLTVECYARRIMGD
jgi:hypothetical protein